MGISYLMECIEKKGNPTVAGLDPELSFIPRYIKDKAFAEHGKTLEGAAAAIWEFNRGLIDALYDVVPAVKPQSAYYEMYGLPGLMVLDKTIKYAKEKGLYVILDVKRNDIGKTAAAYSAAYLGETDIDGEGVRAFLPDGITINPYLGSDGIQPFIFDCNRHKKTVFILIKTSNPSSGELQDLKVGDRFLYEECAKLVGELAGQAIVGNGYSNVGCVVGATYPKQAAVLREMLPRCCFLVPGYGAQGAKAADVKVCFNRDGKGAIVNSSRGIMCAYQKKGRDERAFAAAARDEAIRMRDALIKALTRHSTIVRNI